MKDLEGFNEQYPLNSRLVKRDGKLVEEVYRVGGRYDTQIRADRQPPRGGDSVCDRADGEGAAARSIKFYQTGETADRVAYDIAWVAGQGVAGRHDQRLHRGLHGRARHEGRVGSARLLRQPREDRRHPEARRRRAVVRGPHAVGRRSTAKQGVSGITANAIDVVIETGDSGPITPVGINLPNDQDIREKYGSKSVSLVERERGLRQVDVAPSSAASSPGRRRRRRAPRSGAAVAGELTTDHARGDRPRVGQDRRAAQGQARSRC